ncbi:MAG: RluA family pseudouridine synthase [Clostridiales Family XIII bacterium]|jgi:23S rRNA pseudouridine955/2504/2580 synthase|nr:RluA family pseudouridine synthase [Clostridiales Family XIII bacterium]
MRTLTVNANESGQRLDRFLKKYLRAAPLGLVYRLIRKDIKVNGARAGIDSIIAEGDEVSLYLDDARIDELARLGADGKPRGGFSRRPKVQFKVCFEDENVLIVSKPYGLLTHGDGKEKKDTLVNQVIGYLLEKGEYNPRAERMFTPSPVNRLDRNTTGLVAFGKNSKAVRDFSRMIASGDAVRKYYLTLAAGEIADELALEGAILKDEDSNTVKVTGGGEARPSEGRPSLTIVKPIEVFRVKGAGASAYGGEAMIGAGKGGGAKPVADAGTGRAAAAGAVSGGVKPAAGPSAYKGAYTLCEVLLVTGRPHQIRAHLAESGHPVVGDPKYGNPAVNRRFARDYELPSQFLHACRLEIAEGRGSLEYLTGTSTESPLPERLADILEALRGRAR